jgi:dTDP-3-amino-3,4,6-trideoxy-alpha-D-glucose transaminase
MTVPFLDLDHVHRDVRDEILADVARLIETGAFTNGPQVDDFELAFARYCGTAHCVGLASGLDALRLALAAAGIEKGDDVLVPAQTFVATYEAVTQVGGRPVPVDVTPSDYTMDPAAAEAAITPRTRFAIPVHLYGQMANMTAFIELASRQELSLLEDACQAHGAKRDGVRAGTAGLAGAFSFYPAKNLGAMGARDERRRTRRPRASPPRARPESEVRA